MIVKCKPISLNQQTKHTALRRASSRNDVDLYLVIQWVEKVSAMNIALIQILS